MQKVMVIGCPGSGKSTFSRALSQITGLPLTHLDMLYWNADKTTVERSVFIERLSEVLRKDAWIIDGNYSSTMELRMQECDTVFFLDYPADICLQGVKDRQGKPRPDMPWVETEEDAEFLEYIQNFHKENRPQVLELLQKYSHKTIYVFHNRREAHMFLANCK
jgi:adenylate kinase family enzyme